MKAFWYALYGAFVLAVLAISFGFWFPLLSYSWHYWFG